MAYCPKCKYEYVKGINKCPDCGCELVDELSTVSDVQNNDDNKTELNNSQQISDDHKAITEDEFLDQLNADTTIYRKKSDQYKDLHSSALSLIIVGVVGDLFILLTWLSMTPFDFDFPVKIMFTLVMGCLLNVFLIGGIISYKKAKAIHSEVDAEEKLTSDILEYITSNYTLDFFLKEFGSETEPGSLYFERTKFIRDKIAEKFGDLEESFRENMIEQIYTTIFENDKDL